MKKQLKFLAITLIIAFGLISGSVLNANYAEAQVNPEIEESNCDNTGCRHDMVNGFRCFGVGQASTCDDSDYPTGCSQDAC